MFVRDLLFLSFSSAARTSVVRRRCPTSLRQCSKQLQIRSKIRFLLKTRMNSPLLLSRLRLHLLRLRRNLPRSPKRAPHQRWYLMMCHYLLDSTNPPIVVLHLRIRACSTWSLPAILSSVGPCYHHKPIHRFYLHPLPREFRRRKSASTNRDAPRPAQVIPRSPLSWIAIEIQILHS